MELTTKHRDSCDTSLAIAAHEGLIRQQKWNRPMSERMELAMILFEFGRILEIDGMEEALSDPVLPVETLDALTLFQEAAAKRELRQWRSKPPSRPSPESNLAPLRIIKIVAREVRANWSHYEGLPAGSSISCFERRPRPAPTTACQPVLHWLLGLECSALVPSKPSELRAGYSRHREVEAAPSIEGIRFHWGHPIADTMWCLRALSEIPALHSNSLLRFNVSRISSELVSTMTADPGLKEVWLHECEVEPTAEPMLAQLAHERGVAIHRFPEP